MVALAALENGFDPATVHVCGKAWSWGGRVWHCDKAHGALDMKGAIAQSCDIYFYQTALTVGPDQIAEVARAFGLGEVFDIGIPGQKPGLVPDTAYKRRAFPRIRSGTPARRPAWASARAIPERQRPAALRAWPRGSPTAARR